MLKLKSIEVKPDYRHGYGEGSKPGLACAVEFQIGDKSYNTASINLPPEAVKRVAQFIVAEAMALLTLPEGEIDVEGSPGTEPLQDIAARSASEDAPI